MTVSPARRSAFEILRRVETESAFASVLLAAIDQTMRDDDRALCHELVLGVLRRRFWLDRTIQHFGKRPVERLDLPVRLVLEIGLYQLRFLTRIPASAAVNESVNLVRGARVKSAAAFVNAVLRRATREPDYDPVATIDDPIARLAVETSHPRWLLRRWVDAFGFDEAAAFAGANNQPAPTAIRLTAKSLHHGSHQIFGPLQRTGRLAASKVAPDSWLVTGATRSFRRFADRGLIYFQDEASQLLAYLLQVKPYHRVLDVTAAPGSKATYIPAIEPTAKVIAGDLYPHRVETMRRLAKKQGVAIGIGFVVHDATQQLPFRDATFDRVLLDAPCSGTGTLRRNPEIRYRLKPEDITDLAERQKIMLRRAAAAVRPGGRLVYSTCSVEPEENEHVADRFAFNHPEFSLVEPSTTRSGSRGTPSFLRFLPHRHGCDGFFVACFVRKR